VILKSMTPEGAREETKSLAPLGMIKKEEE
jgi:hypothetical protein